MNPALKQAIITIITTAIISSITTVASTQVTVAVLNEKLNGLDYRVNRCEHNCDGIKKDMYRPSWGD